MQWIKTMMVNCIWTMLHIWQTILVQLRRKRQRRLEAIWNLKGRRLAGIFFSQFFEEDVKAEDFTLSDLIRVAEPNTLHLWSKACEGAIGNLFKMNNISVVNVYPDALDLFGITLFPNNKGDVYYVDPCDNRRYIALDEYFKVLKTARINELQKLAQDLGAKHFKVTYMEQKKSSSSRKTSIAGKFDIKNLGQFT